MKVTASNKLWVSKKLISISCYCSFWGSLHFWIWTLFICPLLYKTNGPFDYPNCEIFLSCVKISSNRSVSTFIEHARHVFSLGKSCWCLAAWKTYCSFSRRLQFKSETFVPELDTLIHNLPAEKVYPNWQDLHRQSAKKFLKMSRGMDDRSFSSSGGTVNWQQISKNSSQISL